MVSFSSSSLAKALVRPFGAHSFIRQNGFLQVVLRLICVCVVGESLLTQSDGTSGVYRPKTMDTQRVYEMMLTFITTSIGSQPRDVICGAADELLQIMKSDNLQVHLLQLAWSNIELLLFVAMLLIRIKLPSIPD